MSSEFLTEKCSKPNRIQFKSTQTKHHPEQEHSSAQICGIEQEAETCVSVKKESKEKNLKKIVNMNWGHTANTPECANWLSG